MELFLLTYVSVFILVLIVFICMRVYGEGNMMRNAWWWDLLFASVWPLIIMLLLGIHIAFHLVWIKDNLRRRTRTKGKEKQ